MYVVVMKGTNYAWHSVVAEAIMAIRKGWNAFNDKVREILIKF